MKISIAYHGTDKFINSIDDIKIDEKSLEQFYGPAFYVCDNKERAAYYGKYIFEVTFNADNMCFGSSLLDIRTNGTFRQFLDMIAKYPDEFLPEKIFDNDSLDDDDIERYIEKYFDKNHKKLLKDYLAEQGEIRCELEDDYDGVMDESQAAIYFPQKVILEFKFVEERPY